jgi:hypothetical protein
MVGVRIRVFGADDDDREIRILSARWREHGCDETRTVVGAQREEHRHGADDMRLEANIAFEPLPGYVGPAGAHLADLEMLLDRVTHQPRFSGRLGFGFDAEPGAPFRGVADKLHV